eukprot:365939-Chlamydomonas_euryale.AAC.13
MQTHLNPKGLRRDASCTKGHECSRRHGDAHRASRQSGRMPEVPTSTHAHPHRNCVRRASVVLPDSRGASTRSRCCHVSASHLQQPPPIAPTAKSAAMLLLWLPY